MNIDFLTTISWGIILTIVFYIASKAGFRKEAILLIVLGEIIPFVCMYNTALSYYNKAVKGQLSITELTNFIQWYTYAISEYALEDVLANIGAIIATFIMEFIKNPLEAL